MASLLRELRLIEPTIKGLEDSRPARSSIKFGDWVSHRSSQCSAVANALNDFESFRGSENLMITKGNGAGSIRPQYFLPKLLDITVERGPTFAVNALKKLFVTGQARVRANCLIWGISVEQPIELSKGVRLLPMPDGEPPPIVRDAIRKFPSHLQIRDCFSLLTTEYIVSPVVMEARDVERIAHPGAAAFDMFRDIASVLCALGPNPVRIEQYWESFVDEKLEAISLMGGPAIAMHDVVPFLLSTPVTKVDKSARRHVEAYLKLQEPVKAKLSGPLGRMNSGMLRRSYGDQALDCGIALEMLLLEDGLNTEIGYRLALRAGLLLGDTLPERRRLRKDVSQLYNIRSNVAHGSLKAHKDGPAIVREGFVACAMIVREIVRRGTFPIWSDLELGSEPMTRQRRSS